MRRLRFEGKMVKGEDIEFSIVKEMWNDYALADGYKLRTRMVVGAVTRILGKKTAEGDPIYVVKSSNHVLVVPPDEGEVH